MPTHTGLTIALPIADRRRSYHFYRKTLRLEPIGDPAEDGIPEPLQFRLDARTVLMLIPREGFGWALGDREVAPPSASECILGLSVITPDEVTRTVERMRKQGGEVLAEPEQQPWGFAGVCTDLDGHAWQIIAPG